MLAAYVAASTLGGLLHDHAGHGHCDVAGCQQGTADRENPGHRAGEADHAREVAGLNQDSPDGDPLHDDDCVVCRFVAQRVVAVETASLERLCKLSVELSIIRVRQATAPIARTVHSRAPPLG